MPQEISSDLWFLFSLRVLRRRTDGRWLIESEMDADANRDATCEGHS
jgi:hypothetical protein